MTEKLKLENGRCLNCKWYVENTGVGPKPVQGHCHRYPAKDTPDYRQRFPCVNDDDWCGEFEHEFQKIKTKVLNKVFEEKEKALGMHATLYPETIIKKR